MSFKNAAELTEAKAKAAKLLFPGKPRIAVGTATCCIAKGADLTLNAMQYAVKSRNIDADVVSVGCSGLCYQEPIVEVHVPGRPKIIYGRVTENEVPRILDALARGEIVSDLAVARIDREEHVIAGPIAYADSSDYHAYDAVAPTTELPYFKKQHKLILRNAGSIDPENIDEYIARGGYQAVVKAFSMQPADIIEEIIKSGLRGRGGGGFPTGLKWKACRQAPGAIKYIICNNHAVIRPGAYG